MGSELLLRSACELSYQIARDGVEAEPPVDPPAAMRSFLYVSDLSGRALTIAQQAIEDDPAFRRRVAEHAQESEVGRAGYLWLHRPIGWAAEFEELSNSELTAPPGDMPPPPTADDAYQLDAPTADVEAAYIADDAFPTDGFGGDAVAEDGPFAESLAEAAYPEEIQSEAGYEVIGDETGAFLVETPPDGIDVEEAIVDDDHIDDRVDDRVEAVTGFQPEGLDFDTSDPEPGPDTADVVDDADTEPATGAASALGFGSISPLANGDGLDLSFSSERSGRSEANAFEDELSSLRGLVDRLSNERKAVSTSVRRVEAEVETSKHQPSMFDSDIYTLQSELDSARAELDRARAERDAAVQQRSESLTRQLELERELERSRAVRAEIESGHAEVDAEMVRLQEQVSRAESAQQTTEADRDELRSQVTSLTATNEALNTQLARLNEDSEERFRGLESDTATLRAEADTLAAANEESATKLAALEAELGDAKSELTQTEAQAAEAKSLVDALTEEKIDLASRLADTEAMLETTRAQLSAVKSDSEAVAADLSNIKAHRDGLSTQVEELHQSLSDALSDLAKVRESSDADRASLKDTRAERDLLRVRIGSLEQVEAGLEAKLGNITAERDALAVQVETVQAELTQEQRVLRDLRQEKDDLSRELVSTVESRTATEAQRDELRGEIQSLSATGVELETTRDGLQQQVDQLNEENSSLQSQLVEAERLRVEAAENQGRALSELAQRLSLVENERGRLQSDVEEAEQKLADALVMLESTRDETERLRRENRDRADELAAFKAAPPPAPVAPVAAPAPVSSFGGRMDAPPPPVAPPVSPSSAPALGPDPDPTVPPGFVESGQTNDDLAAEAAEAAEARVAEVEEEADDKTRSGRRWPLGSLRRGERDTDDADVDLEIPSATDPVVEPEAATPDPFSGSLDDDVAAALARTLQEDAAPSSEPELEPETTGEPAAQPSVSNDAVSNDDIDSISSELAQAVGTTGTEPGEDEDLDEISDLISQTITDFDPKSLDRPSFGDTAPSDQRVSSDPLRSRTEDRPVSGSLPPSVFDDDTVAAEPVAAVGGNQDETPGRRQIDIPPALADDDIELARHVVSYPDVVLLVDGDAVAQMGWPNLPVAQQRDALVSYLSDLSANSGAAPDVVFDGRIGEEDSLPASRAVRIRLSTPPTEPAAALDELVDAYPDQWPIAIVTDDQALGRSASGRGAVVLGNGQLLDLFIS